MYLANDVIQNSKKKGPEYGREFLKVLLKAFQHIGDSCANDEKTLGSLSRILNIWEERSVYDAKTVHEFRAAVQPTPSSAATSLGSTPALDEDLHSNGSDSNDLGGGASLSGATKRKTSSASISDVFKDGAGKRQKSNSSGGTVATDLLKSETTIEVNGAVEKHVVLSQHEPAGWFFFCGMYNS